LDTHKILFKTIFKNSEKLNLLLSQILIAAIGLLTGKIIAVYFTPEDYGLYNLQFALYTFLFSLLVFPLMQFFKSTTKTLLPKIGYSFYLYLGILLMMLFYLIIIVFFCFRYKVNLFFSIILLFAIPSNILFNLLMDYFNINNKLNLFSAMNLLKSIGGICFISLLYYYNYKYTDGSSVLWMIQIVGFLSGSLFFIPYFKIKLIGFFNVSFKNFLNKYYLFAWPLITLAFWGWINNYSDRFFIEYYLDIKQVGIYNANYSLGSKFFLLLNPMFLTLLAPKVYSNVTSEKRKKIINKYVSVYILISIPILIMVYFLNNYIGLMLLSKSYESGFYMIFWIAVAYFFLTLVFLYETIFYADGITKIILYSNILAAVINIILNIIFIPYYGLNGALVSTLLSFTTRFFVVKFYFNRL
jgi:O-antigen/teichoic acid export membrane protein